MPRLFVALEIPPAVRQELARLRRGMPGARWVPEEQFHLTLAFLGEVEGPASSAVQEGLHGVRGDPFLMELAAAGRFPHRGQAKVLWAGIRQATEVLALIKEVQRCLKRRGLLGESRRPSPHVTLARLRGAPPQALDDYLEALAGWVSGPFSVTEFHLYSSHLGREGAQHRIEASYPLIPARLREGR